MIDDKNLLSTTEPIYSFKNLLVWERSRIFAVDVYELCKLLPKDEQYSICNQMKRAAVSVPSNIAEGYRRNNRKEFANFLSIAIGSMAELETQLLITQDVFEIVTITLVKESVEIQKMLASLLKKYRN